MTGMHADDTLSISSGTIDITRSYEGLEGAKVLISGGKISIVASDDGINAAGGSDQSGSGGFGFAPDSFGGSGITSSVSPAAWSLSMPPATASIPTVISK